MKCVIPTTVCGRSPTQGTSQRAWTTSGEGFGVRRKHSTISVFFYNVFLNMKNKTCPTLKSSTETDVNGFLIVSRTEQLALAARAGRRMLSTEELLQSNKLCLSAASVQIKEAQCSTFKPQAQHQPLAHHSSPMLTTGLARQAICLTQCLSKLSVSLQLFDILPHFRL